MTQLRPVKIEMPIQLLVEGKDQVNFFTALCRHLNIENYIQIQNFGGINDLKQYLSVFTKTPGFVTVETLGIVRDAEACAKSARDSIINAMQDKNLHSIEQIEWNLQQPYFILPDNYNPGNLETLLKNSIDNIPVNRCIKNFFNCVKELNFELRNPDKAFAQVYLSTQNKPGVSVGVAALKGYWDLDNSTFSEIRSFLQCLVQS